VKKIGLDVLRHRITISYEAEAEEMDSDAVIARLFDAVEVP
jgi:MoxR-like ATPase